MTSIFKIISVQIYIFGQNKKSFQIIIKFLIWKFIL